MSVSLQSESSVTAPQIRIAPSNGWLDIDLGALWEYRELIYFLVARDVKSRYRQMALGVLWLLLKPVSTMVIFSIIFSRVARLPTDGVPAPLFYFSALLPWTFFTTALQQSASSLSSNMHLISKIYFPRLVVPIASVFAAFVDFGVSLAVFLVISLSYGTVPTLRILIIPVPLLLAAGTALGVGLWLAALAVRFRDVSQVLGMLIQAWMYASPVIYPASMVPKRWHLMYQLNPLTQVIEASRYALLGHGDASVGTFLVSVLVMLLMLVTGAYYFQKTERSVVDLL